jgi:hypothetical protein
MLGKVKKCHMESYPTDIDISLWSTNAPQYIHVSIDPIAVIKKDAEYFIFLGLLWAALYHSELLSILLIQ